MVDESVSVIIISKNEEKRIEKCIESVLSALKDFPNSEVILVDSASIDKTVERAKKYPIKIIQLRPDWQHSAAAGEYIGFLHSKGDYICFIDGDMELNPKWFKNALPYLNRDDVVGVSGKIINIFENDNCSRLVRKRINRGFELLKSGEVDVLGGPAMFKRSILEEGGCYHPFLTAGEEAELSHRIRSKGYKLLRLSIPMVIHKVGCVSLFSLLKKYEWEYVKAVGSSIRYTFKTNKKIFWRRLPDLIIVVFFNFYLIFVIWSVFVLTIKGYLLFTAIAIVGYFLLFFLSYIRRRDLEDALLSILIVHVRALAMFVGFLTCLPDPQEYPNNPITIK